MLGGAYVGSVWGNWREERKGKSLNAYYLYMFVYIHICIIYILIDNWALIIVLVLDFVQDYKCEK